MLNELMMCIGPQERVAASLQRFHANAEREEEMLRRSREMIARSKELLSTDAPKVWWVGREDA